MWSCCCTLLTLMSHNIHPRNVWGGVYYLCHCALFSTLISCNVHLKMCSERVLCPRPYSNTELLISLLPSSQSRAGDSCSDDRCRRSVKAGGVGGGVRVREEDQSLLPTVFSVAHTHHFYSSGCVLISNSLLLESGSGWGSGSGGVLPTFPIMCGFLGKIITVKK